MQEPEDYRAILATVKQNGMALQQAPDQFRKHYNIILAAVRQNGMALQYAILDNMTINRDTVEDPSINFFINSSFLLWTTNQPISSYSYPNSENLQKKEIVLAAVKQNGMALQFASGELRNNYEIVLAAVKQNGMALKFTPGNLADEFEPNVRNNFNIVLVAVKKNGLAFKFASKRLRNHNDIIQNAIQQNKSVFWYLPPILRHTDVRVENNAQTPSLK